MILDSQRFETAEMTSKVIQGHRKRNIVRDTTDVTAHTH